MQYIITILSFLLLMSCADRPVATLSLRADDPALVSHGDTVFYHHQKFTGKIYQLYPQGDTAATGSYMRGLKNGSFVKWYPNGNLQEQRYYVNENKVGVHRGFWENGKPKFEYEFRNGEHDGIFKEWYNNGAPYKNMHYAMGYEDGSQKLWWENGVIRANYVVKKGRRYGLIGLKLCMNPKDSIENK